MVQILRSVEKKPSVGQRLSAGVGQGLQQAQQFYQQHQQNQQHQQQQQAFAQMFPEAAGMSPEMQKEYAKYVYESGLQQQKMANQLKNEKNESQLNFQEEQKRYNTIKENFGQKAADIYAAAPEGGKTAIIQNLLENAQRGGNFDEMLQGQIPNQNIEEPSGKPVKTIDYDKGLTPKERTTRQNDRYAKNLPLYQESVQRSHGLESERQGLDILDELSPQIGAIERLNINPSTGELIVPALASKETQRFVKTINDFTTKAKDSYGSRVTNFDLTQFMKRLPNLANSEEARRDIIKQMKLINDINYEYEKNLQDIIEEHGGIRNIDYDVAEKLAEKRSQPQIKEYKKQFKDIDKDLDKQNDRRIEEFKKKTPVGSISVIRADGTPGYISKDKLKQFLKKNSGNKVL